MVLWFMRRKYLNDPTLFLHFCDYPPFEEDLDLYLNRLEFPSCKKCLYQVWLKLAKRFFFPIHVYTCKNSFPSCPPTWPSRTIICMSLNLHYVRKLSCKYELFLLSGSQRKEFSMTSLNLCIFMIISPLKRTWRFIWTI
jgi:hypothetical protein